MMARQKRLKIILKSPGPERNKNFQNNFLLPSGVPQETFYVLVKKKKTFFYCKLVKAGKKVVSWKLFWRDSLQRQRSHHDDNQVSAGIVFVFFFFSLSLNLRKLWSEVKVIGNEKTTLCPDLRCTMEPVKRTRRTEFHVKIFFSPLTFPFLPSLPPHRFPPSPPTSPVIVSKFPTS